MIKRETQAISLVVLAHETDASGDTDEKRSMFPSLQRMPTKTIEVSVEALSAGLSSIVKQLQDIMEVLPFTCGQYNIDELTFSLSINGSGKVSLVGEIGAGFVSGICIKLKRSTTQ